MATECYGKQGERRPVNSLYLLLELWFANAARKDLKRTGWYLEQRDLCFSPVDEVDPDTFSYVVIQFAAM